MRAWLLLTAVLAVPAAAQNLIPAPSQNAQGEVAVTIYNNDLALVQDTRRLDLAAGRSRREFPDVSAQIRPATVSLSGEGVAVVEQNFDFDLLSPQALIQKAVGETMATAIQAALVGQASVKDALTEAQSRIDGILKG